jgi:cytidylate kinase
MIITFNGDHGSGKSTIAKKIAEEIDYPRYYMGQIFRDLAKKRNLTLIEYLKLGETDSSIDKDVDDRIVELAKEKKDFVIESRTAWHFIPESLKIFLKVDEAEGVKRMFRHLKKSDDRDNEDKRLKTLQDVLQSNRKRKSADDKRYKKYYGIDGNDMNNYDLVLDTTNLSIDEVFQKILLFIQNKMQKN